MPQPIDFAALSLLPPRSRPEIAERLRHGHHPRDILNAILSLRRRDADLTPQAVQMRAARALERGAAAGITLIAWTDAGYPPPLAALIDPPPALWVRGSTAAFVPPAVAIVGSRVASPYALAVAERLAADLSCRGLAVVSGLARGVDSAAHRGSLAAAGITVAVLGSGADVVYPSEHSALAGEIIERGALVSELAPGTRPLAHFFPMRNRIISGLSRAVVVIEAGERSGSLITARCALEQGRDVLAVPGNVLSGRNRGGHALLRDGAKIVETADDILEEMGAVGSPPGAARPSRTAAVDPILACLTPGEPCDLDALAVPACPSHDCCPG